jgi:PAS domain S-box-containing protein
MTRVPQPRRSLLSESLFGEALIRGRIAAFLIRDDAIIAANRAACQLTGYDEEELVALSVSHLRGPRAPHEEDEAARRRELAARGVWQSGSGGLRRKDGETRAVRYVGGRTTVGSTPMFLALAWEAAPASAAPGDTGDRVVDWVRTVGIDPASGADRPGESGAGGRESTTRRTRRLRTELGRVRPALRRRG